MQTVKERPQPKGDDDAKAAAKAQAEEARAKAAQEKAKAEQQKAKAKADEAKQKAAAAEQAKQEKRQQWLDRVDNQIAAAAEVEAQRDPESIAKQLDSMEESSREADVLMPHDKSGIRDRVRLAKRTMYERHVDHLLDCAMAATHDRNREQERNEILKNCQAKFTIAMKLGSGEDIRESVRYRLGIIRETSAAGISQKAKENAEREAQRKEAAYPNERRVFARWTDPPLVVMIADHAYTTANWSLGGLLIEGFDGTSTTVKNATLKAGDELEIKVGLDNARLYTERVQIVRLAPDDKLVAVKSRRFASVLLQIKRDCDLDDIEPS